MKGRRSINFLMGDFLESDKDLFFGPIRESDEWFVLPPGNDWSQALALAGLFKSRSEAIRQGWRKPIEPGFDTFLFGKLKHEVSILNIT